MEQMEVSGKAYTAIRLLGHGKGGYSWLVTDGEGEYVLKQIHHEPCDYYQFGDKLGAELRDYERLKGIGIPVPELYEADVINERLLKEYIAGATIRELADQGAVKPEHLAQVRAMSARAREAGLNIDYYPTNFVARDGVLWYIDYECNPYSEEWSFERWGSRYWTVPGQGDGGQEETA